MANVKHADLTGANLHEPKGVAAASTGHIYVANGGGGGVWKKANEVDSMDYSNKAKNVYGWNDIADSLYTVGSPQSIGSGVRTHILNNALGTQTDTSRLGALWNPTLHKFVINDLNAVYNIRINCRIKATAAAGTPYICTFEFETSNGPTALLGNTQFIKGGSAVNAISFTTTLYMGSFINNTDIELYITPDTAITMYDIGFVIQRTYKET